MQGRALVTEGKGKETVAPARAKKGLEEAAWANHKKSPTSSFYLHPLPDTPGHVWDSTIESIQQYSIVSVQRNALQQANHP